MGWLFVIRHGADSPTRSAKSNPVHVLLKSYKDNTAPKLKLIDTFLVSLMLSGAIQFLYAIFITNFPFNSFISGFASTVGQFVLLASLRTQANPINQATYEGISPERCVYLSIHNPHISSFQWTLF